MNQQNIRAVSPPPVPEVTKVRKRKQSGVQKCRHLSLSMSFSHASMQLLVKSSGVKFAAHVGNQVVTVNL